MSTVWVFQIGNPVLLCPPRETFPLKEIYSTPDCNKCVIELLKSCLLISCDTLINIFQCVESDSHSSGCVCSRAWLWYWQDHWTHAGMRQAIEATFTGPRGVWWFLQGTMEMRSLALKCEQPSDETFGFHHLQQLLSTRESARVNASFLAKTVHVRADAFRWQFSPFVWQPPASSSEAHPQLDGPRVCELHPWVSVLQSQKPVLCFFVHKQSSCSCNQTNLSECLKTIVGKCENTVFANTHWLCRRWQQCCRTQFLGRFWQGLNHDDNDNRIASTSSQCTTPDCSLHLRYDQGSRLLLLALRSSCSSERIDHLLQLVLLVSVVRNSAIDRFSQNMNFCVERRTSRRVRKKVTRSCMNVGVTRECVEILLAQLGLCQVGLSLCEISECKRRRSHCAAGSAESAQPPNMQQVLHNKSELISVSRMWTFQPPSWVME